MRNAFADEVTRLAIADERVVLLSGDIGNRLFDDLKERVPDRFFNCGVAEANMMSLAAGLALSGLRPIVYTITPFVTSRCLEQIRDDVCYHDVGVTIVGTGAGLSYATLGATHHSLEDMGMLRLLPNMKVLAPADPQEVRWALRAALKQEGPVYMRLGKKGEPKLHAEIPDLPIGRWMAMRGGADLALLAAGTMLPVAIETAERLAAKGLAAATFSCPSIKPLDSERLAELFARSPLVVTIEEHSAIGGFGAAVAEWLADQPPQRARLMRCATADRFLHASGEQHFAREQFGLTAEAIAERVLALLAPAARALV
jgi:transketolase